MKGGNLMKMDLERLTIDAAKAKIKQELERNGPYSHNIIGLVLGQVAKQFSKASANRLIDECGLQSKGWEKQ